MIKNIKTIILVMALLAGPLNAQIVKKAQVGFRFLENPVSAEVIGRGQAGITTTFNANGIFWNPALLGRIESQVDLNLNHTNGIAEINYNSAAASFRLGNFGVVGLSLLAMDYGTFYGTRRAANDAGYEETGEFTPNAYAIGLGFSQKVSDRFSYGVHIKLATQDLGSAWISTSKVALSDPALVREQRSYKKSELAFDVGAHYDFMYHGITFGAVIQNISREIKFENEEFPMPFAISFGATIEPLSFFDVLGKDQRFILSLESRSPRDFEQKFKVGGEFNFYEMFCLRAGYMDGYDERGLTAGLGFKYAYQNIPFRFDYAFMPFGVFGGVHSISLGISY